MLKIETTGDFMLIDPDTGIEINPGTITEVSNLSSFIQERIELKQLRIVKDEPAAPAPVAPNPTPPSEPSQPKPRGRPRR